MKTSALLALALLAFPLAAQTGLKPLVKDAPPPEPKAPANPPEPPKETIFALKLKAVGAPLPILRHELLPSQRELSKTNAAVYYHRAMLMMGDSGLKGKEAGEARMKMDELLGKPLAETPAESLRPPSAGTPTGASANEFRLKRTTCCCPRFKRPANWLFC